AHGVLAGDGCHPQDLGVFVIVDGRHLMLFHQRDHRVKEVAKDPHGGSECGAIGGQAVDDDARRLEVFDHLLDLVEMAIDLNLLRRIVLDTNHSSRDLRLELDPETLGVPLDLSRRLVQAEHETSLAAPRALGDVLQTHHALADAGDPHDQRGAPEEVSAVDDLVEARHTRRNPRLGIEGRGQFTRHVSRRLYTPVYLETVAINDPEGMTPHFKLMTARLHHVDRSTDRAVDVVNAEHHDRVRNEPFDRRCRQTNAFETRRFNGQHRGDILTMQSLHKHVKHFTRAPVVAVVARLTIRRQGWQGVDEHPPGTDLRGFGQQEAIRLLEFLLQHRARGEDDLDLALSFELRKVPPKLRGVADDFVWGHLEEDDQARLLEFGDSAIDEF